MVRVAHLCNASDSRLAGALGPAFTTVDVPACVGPVIATRLGPPTPIDCLLPMLYPKEALPFTGGTFSSNMPAFEILEGANDALDGLALTVA
jgi:hypothetical protein